MTSCIAEALEATFIMETPRQWLNSPLVSNEVVLLLFADGGWNKSSTSR